MTDPQSAAETLRAMDTERIHVPTQKVLVHPAVVCSGKDCRACAALQALALVERLRDLSPWTCAYGGSQHHRGPCFFCGVEPSQASDTNQRHEPDCLWLAARASLTGPPEER